MSSAVRHTFPVMRPPIEAVATSTRLCGGVGPCSEHYTIAQAALRRAGHDDLRRPHQVALVARETWLRLRHLLNMVWLPTINRVTDETDMLPADAFVCDVIEGIGPQGALFAEDLRQKSRRRWAAYVSGVSAQEAQLWHNWHRTDFAPTTMPIAAVVAYVVWLDVLKPKVDAMPYPAISAAVLDQAIDNLRQGQSNTLWCHRVFRWATHAAFVQRLCSEPDVDIEIAGGLQGLVSHLVPESSRGCVALVGKALTSMVGSKWLTFTIRPSAPGRSAVLQVAPSEILLPGHVVALPKATLAQRRARTLVPIPATIPPCVGRRPDHAAQCTLQLLLMAEFRAQAQIVEDKGAICLSDSKLANLAARAGLSARLAHAVIDFWGESSSQGGVSILRGGRNLVAMGPALHAAEEFIKQAAEQQRNGLAAQRRGRRRHQRQRRQISA